MEVNNNISRNSIQQSNPTQQITTSQATPQQANIHNSPNTQNQIMQDNINLDNAKFVDNNSTITFNNAPNNTNLNEVNNNIAKFSSMIGNPFQQNPFYQNPYNNPYLINSDYYDPITTNNNSGNLWKYLLVGGLGLLTGAALSSMMFYSYPLYYPMYYSYYYSPCWYNFYPYMWW